MGVKVSVVLPTFKRPRLLRRCLRALAVQVGCGPADYEILVVDDGRSADTEAQVHITAQQRRHGPAIRYLQPPAGRRGPAAARNAGWRAAEGDIIAFTDDDTVPARTWLSEGLRALTEDAAAAWGRVIVPARHNPPTDWERNTARLDGAEFVTANCFVRRDTLADIGGFDERFTRPWREDSDLYFTLLERGCKVISAPAAKVVHPVRLERPGISLRQHRNLFFDALLYKKHRRLYRQKIAAAPPLRYYATVAAMIVCLIALATGHFMVAAAGAGLWLALTVFMVLRRLRGTSRQRRHVLDMIVTSIAIPAVAIYWRLAGALHFRVLFA